MNSISTERIIGHYQGQEAGPLLIAITGLHGNETAAGIAMARLFDLLAQEPSINPSFAFKGDFLALRGNLSALARGQRFIDQDLNRIWDEACIAALQADDSQANTEEQELLELLAAIEIAVEEAQPREVILIDLHTTTASGGIFLATADDPPSLLLAAELYAPLVEGMLQGLKNTFLHYFQAGRFGKDIAVRALAFEAGAHNDPRSIDRALAMVVNIFRDTGCVEESDVRTLHDELLASESASLPPHTRLVYTHQIEAADQFQMQAGFDNFSPIKKGDLLGQDVRGAVLAPTDGYLLMPLYQKQGKEGFFIVQDIQAGIVAF